MALILSLWVLALPQKLPAPPPSIRYAQPGESETGVVVGKPGDELALNVDPCGTGPIVTFKKPYTPSPAGTKTCPDNTTRTLTQVLKN